MTKIVSWVLFAAALFSAYNSTTALTEVSGYDFSIYYYAAKWFTTSTGDGAFPVVYQGTVPFLMPFTYFDIKSAFFLYSIVNLVATFVLFLYLSKKLGMNWNLKAPDLETLYVAIGLFIFVSTSPVHIVLKTGQISMMAYFLYIYSILGNFTFLRIVALGSCVAMKFSLFTLLVPLMFVKKQRLVVFWGMIVFCILSLFPLLFHFDPWENLAQYGKAIRTKTAMIGGYDTYGASPNFTFLHFDFFKNNAINLIGKGIFIILGLIILHRESKNPSVFSLQALVALSCITMELSYHRVYDLCFVMAALAIGVTYFLKEKEYKKLAMYAFLMCGCFCIFRLFFGAHASIAIGQFIGENSWIYLCSKGQTYLNFPSYAVMMVFLTLWTSYHYLKTPSMRAAD